MTEVGADLRAALSGPATAVAPQLLGWTLESTGGGARVAVRLTEVEAYQGLDDPGSHAFRGKTARTAVMFGLAGHAYVYFVYGMHWCMNVVCGPNGTAAAVLLRAGEVVDGHETARVRRPAARRDVELAQGPARLAAALGVDGRLNGADLLAGGQLRLRPGAPTPDDRVCTGPRVGVGGAGGANPWRYWIRDEPTVSAYRAHTPRRRGPACT